MIAHLKDQLQEMKAKTAMERKYVHKSSLVSVQQTKKKCDSGIAQLQEETKVQLSGNQNGKRFCFLSISQMFGGSRHTMIRFEAKLLCQKDCM